MDAIDEIKRDVAQGRIGSDRLIDLISLQQRELQTARLRIAELEKQLGGSPTVKTAEPFSMRAEEKRQEARGKKKKSTKLPKGRNGRFASADKIAQAERTEAIFPEGVPHSDCKLSHTRPVWRLENNRAVLVAYQIYRGPGSQYGKIPNVLGRSEFGIEIVVAITHLVHIVGLSFDKVCVVLNFFQNLKLRKSQVDRLLQQLSRHWQEQFEVLCTLLANSAVVHADETSWSLNSVWAFLSEKARVMLFGVHKDAQTLEQILNPATFAGIVISDDAAVYANFTASQKCWAHLLRKAIKLTLLEPDNEEYRDFTDRLLEIYRKACRLQQDQRFGDAGRAQKVVELDDAIFDLCGPMWCLDLPPLEGSVDDYRLLANELMRLMLAKQLFTFVTAKPVKQPNGETRPVAGTNNEAERSIRGQTEARKTGRTNKTLSGARRRTVLVSVLESLRVYLKEFTLSTVIAEVTRWATEGRSCFEKLLKKLKLSVAEESILDRLLPDPSG